MSDIDETTGLPTAEWDIGEDRKGRTQAVWKQEEEYVIQQIGGGQWSLEEAGESLGSFDTASAAAAALPKIDGNPWEDLDGRNKNLYLGLAPVNFDEWVSGETDTIFLRRENGSWWLSVTGETGQSDYPTRQQGMIAGLEIYQESWDKSHEKITKSLELDDSDWRVEFDNGNITAIYLHDESILLQADDSSARWAMFNGDEIVGNYKTAKDGAAAVPARAMTL
jgi:hypothetical protein